VKIDNNKFCSQIHDLEIGVCEKCYSFGIELYNDYSKQFREIGKIDQKVRFERFFYHVDHSSMTT